METPDASLLLPVITPAGGFATFHAFGDDVTVLLGGEQTGGKYACAMVVTQPGGGPPPHYHENEDEWFVVLEGEVEFWVDGAITKAGPGQAAFLPKGVPHRFRNTGATPLRMIIHTAPAGFEVFFARMTRLFAEDGGADMERIVKVSAEHGIHYLPPA